MREDERLSAVISDIYDAALDASLWPAVLGKTADFCEAWQAALFWKDATSKSGGVFFDDGRLERRYVQLYFDTYLKFDPTTTAQFFAAIGQPIATEDIMPYDDFRETRFYREWVKPQNLADFACAVLDRSATSIAVFGAHRHESQGLVDDEMRRRMSLLVPHVRRAVLIGRAIELRAAEAESFADSFDALAAGLFLVSAAGRIVYANVAGHAMLGAGTVLREREGRLSAGTAEAERQLHDSVSAAASGDLGVKGIAVPLSCPRGEPHVAHLLPLTSGARRRAGASYAAVAAVFVHAATLDLPSPPTIIAQCYGLTPTELRVLLAIVDVGGVPEVASSLGVAPSTVKTHVARLYTKTGCRRQAELVKLVAGMSRTVGSQAADREIPHRIHGA